MTNFDSLDTAQKQYFYNLASKGDSSAREIFDTLPEAIQDSPEEVETFLDTRDASRIISGENGGDYSADNLTWEDASLNRSRGADNMTDFEVTQANDFALADAERIDALAQAGEASVSEAGADLLGGTAALLEDIVAPAIIAGKAAHMAHKSGANTAVTAGVGVGAFTVVTCTGIGPAILGGYAAWKLGRFAWRALSR